MRKQEEHNALTFDPQQVMDEWRRLYDWAVLSRKPAENIEMISCLGQKFSGTLSAYRLSKRPQRHERLLQELIGAFEAMKTFMRAFPQGVDSPSPGIPTIPNNPCPHDQGRL